MTLLDFQLAFSLKDWILSLLPLGLVTFKVIILCIILALSQVKQLKTITIENMV